MDKSIIRDLCNTGLITKTGILNSKVADRLKANELFTKQYITVTGLLSGISASEPVMAVVDPNDAEAVAQAQAAYDAAVAARNAAIESRLINYVEQIKKWAGQAESQLCDWLMMDPSSPAYIKNRTHYRFIDTPTKTTATIGDKDCGIAYDELNDIVMLFYATGLQEEVTIWNDPKNPIKVHVNGESLIPAEFHFDPETGDLESYQALPVSIFLSGAPMARFLPGVV